MENEKLTVSDRVIVYMVCALILVFTGGFFLSAKRDFSENENRKLAQFPEYSFTALKEGRFTDGIKEYVTDQFPMRDEFLGIHSEALRMSGRKEIGGVYLAGDGSLINAYEEPKNIDKDITQWTKLADNLTDARVSLMLVPTAVTVNKDRLPKQAPDRLAQELYERSGLLPEGKSPAAVQQSDIDRIYSAMAGRADCIDVSAALKEDAEKALFYRTDHHWTTYGAYIGYQCFCKSRGLTPTALEAYTAETVTEEFQGTIYSKLNDPWFGSDSITLYSDPSWELTVDYGDVGSDSPYDLSYLDMRDKYSLFLSNQHSFITITNDAVPEERGAIALVKDSYANCFVPFLLNHYHTVYIFDTRYYKGGPSKFINEHPGITDVLILYNMGTLDSDTGIGGIY